MLAIILFYSIVVHVRLVLGHWPALNHPDPKSVDFALFNIHRALIVAAAMMTSVSPVAWLMALPMAQSSISLKSFWCRLALYLFCLAAFLALCRIDPGNFITRFLD